MFDIEVIVRRQDQEHCASITCMIRYYVARRAEVIEDYPHNVALGAFSGALIGLLGMTIQPSDVADVM